jgi:hypothetical protein
MNTVVQSKKEHAATTATFFATCSGWDYPHPSFGYVSARLYKLPILVKSTS